MNVTLYEADQIASDIIEAISGSLPDEGRLTITNLLYERFETIRTAIFARRGHTWDDHNQRWIENDEIANLQVRIDGLNEALKIRIAQAEKMAKQIDAIQRIVA